MWVKIETRNTWCSGQNAYQIVQYTATQSLHGRRITRADAPSQGRALASAGVAGNLKEAFYIRPITTKQQNNNGRRMCLGQLTLLMRLHELTLQSAPRMNSSLMTAACPLLAARCAGVVPTWKWQSCISGQDTAKSPVASKWALYCAA
jgi:hypothetical protein